MSSEMVERVARAVEKIAWIESGHEPLNANDHAEIIARAAIEAIREPTEPMVKAFVHLALHGDVLSHGGWPGYARDQWAGMIDAALSPTLQDPPHPL